MNAVAQPATESQRFRREFVEFAMREGVLRFGEFKTKAGRLSPYFFNAGLFNDGYRLGRLGEYYAKAALGSGIGFDMLFGPAYKGITLASATAVALAHAGHNHPAAAALQQIEGGIERRPKVGDQPENRLRLGFEDLAREIDRVAVQSWFTHLLVAFHF